MRAFLIPVLLLSVLSIGFPWSTPYGDLSYSFLRKIGLDVPMTPMTVDMAMMSDANGKFVYEKVLKLKVYDGLKHSLIVDPKVLNFHLHKIPLILYYEVLARGGNMPEGRVFICRSLSDLMNFEITGFEINAEFRDQVSKGLNELQSCY